MTDGAINNILTDYDNLTQFNINNIQLYVYNCLFYDVFIQHIQLHLGNPSYNDIMTQYSKQLNQLGSTFNYDSYNDHERSSIKKYIQNVNVVLKEFKTNSDHYVWVFDRSDNIYKPCQHKIAELNTRLESNYLTSRQFLSTLMTCRDYLSLYHTEDPTNPVYTRLFDMLSVLFIFVIVKYKIEINIFFSTSYGVMLDTWKRYLDVFLKKYNKYENEFTSLPSNIESQMRSLKSIIDKVSVKVEINF